MAAPEIQAICRSALARDVVAAEPIGAGRNSRVFRVDLDGPARTSVVVKCYRRDHGDRRDRLGTEFGGLQFLWRNGVRAIPRPIAVDCDRQFAVYEFIDGEVLAPEAITPADVDESVDFLGALRRLRLAPGADALAAASEACFSIADIVRTVERRLEPLRSVPGGGAEATRSIRWIDTTFNPLLRDVVTWCCRNAEQSGIAFHEVIGRDSRTLSPSDFGFHNAIRRPAGPLAFVDFEYFGWDDPAKTIADYLLHPGMAIGTSLKRLFADRALAAFADVPRLATRASIVYPLFGLKWALILLNDFLPERFSESDSERRAAQLAKAQALSDRIAAEYERNPYLT